MIISILSQRQTLYLSTAFLVLILSYSCLNSEQRVSYATIGDLRLKSLGLSLNDQQATQEVKDIKQALLISMDEDQKRRTVYQLCAQMEKKKRYRCNDR